MKVVKITSKIHLTKLDKDMVKFSVAEGVVPVSTARKRLTNIVKNSSEEYSAILWSYEDGIGLGAKKRWIEKPIEFKVK